MKLRRLKALRMPYKVGIDNALVDTAGVFLGDSCKDLFALERNDDYSVRWQVAGKGHEPMCVAGGVLVLGAWNSGWLRGVDVASGDALWVAAGWGATCQPWRQGELLVHEDSQHCISLDARSGRLIRRYATTASHIQVVGDEHAILQSDEGAVRCITLDADEIVWTGDVFSVARDCATLPGLLAGALQFHAPDTIVVQRNDGFAAFRLSTGILLWSRCIPGRPTAYATVDMGCVVAATVDQMVCLDVETGSVLWTRALQAPDWARGNESSASMYLTHPPRETYRGAFVLMEREKTIRLVEPRTGASIAEFVGPRLGSAIAAGDDEIVSVLGNGRYDILSDRGTVSARPGPRAPRPAATPSDGGPGSLVFDRSTRVKLPLARPGNIVASDDGLFVSGEGGGPCKVTVGDFRIAWQLPPETSAIVSAGQGLAFVQDRRAESIRAVDGHDGSSRWRTRSQRCQAWFSGSQVAVAPPGQRAIHLLDPASGRLEQSWPLRLDRVIGVVGGLVVASASISLPDIIDSVSQLADEPGLIEGLADAVDHGTEHFHRMLSAPSPDIQVVDLSSGDTLWHRDLSEDLCELAGLAHDHLRMEVFGLTNDWLVLGQPGHLWGVSTATGAVVWHAASSTRPRLIAGRLWSEAPSPAGLVYVDITNGSSVLRPNKASRSVRIIGSYGEYVVSGTTAAVDLFHPSKSAQRFKVVSCGDIAVGIPSYLVLNDLGGLRILKDVVIGADPGPAAPA